MSSGWQRWRHLNPRTPVIVGVGTATQHFDEPGAGDDALQLMTNATMAAARDCGALALLETIGLVSVPGGSWSYRNPGRSIAEAVGAARARTVLMTAGIPQQTLFNDAYLDVLAGHVDVALIVGGEAAHRAASARRAGLELRDAPDEEGEPDEVRRPEGGIISAIEIAAGVYSPVQQFALIESALRAAEARTLDEHREEIARLWAGFSEVASRFPLAAFREPRSAAFIREPGPENRPLSFPYNKWHCSQMNVDQAAAVLVCTLEVAEAVGVDPRRVVFPLVALESSFSLALPRRRDIHRWPAMEVLGAAAAAHIGAPLHRIEHAEIYSCFPAAVRVQQRALGLPLDGVPTITGGEPFAGGPWNNFVLQATAAMVDRVRSTPGTSGLVTTVSGFLNKPGLAIYSTEPTGRPLLVADLAAEAAEVTPTVEIADGYLGPATVVAYTVSHERNGTQRVIVLADTPAGERCLATSTDAALAEDAVTNELIGSAVRVDGVELFI